MNLEALGNLGDFLGGLRHQENAYERFRNGLLLPSQCDQILGPLNRLFQSAGVRESWEEIERDFSLEFRALVESKIAGVLASSGPGGSET